MVITLKYSCDGVIDRILTGKLLFLKQFILSCRVLRQMLQYSMALFKIPTTAILRQNKSRLFPRKVNLRGRKIRRESILENMYHRHSH